MCALGMAFYELWWNFILRGASRKYMAYLWPRVIQGHFPVIHCICLKVVCNSKPNGRREKRIEMTLVKHTLRYLWTVADSCQFFFIFLFFFFFFRFFLIIFFYFFIFFVHFFNFFYFCLNFTWPFKVTKGNKGNRTNVRPIYAFLLMFNSNICPMFL